MAFTQVSLPAPAGNGSGAAVDVSALGAEKTITVTSGGSAVLKPSVIVEMSNQTVPTKWAPVAFFAPSGEETVLVAARWMRATVANFKEGVAPTVEVGSTDDGATFDELVAPAGNGTGAGVDVSALPIFKTVHVAGPFQGTVNIDVSEDGGVTYQQAFSFPPNESGIQSKVIAADFMRVTRNGVPTIDPGLPIINVGASGMSGGGSVVGTFQELVIDPSEPEPFGPGANMPAGIIANWTQPGLGDHTNLEWRGADNQGTVLLSIDSTGVPEGAVRIFNNATNSPGDAGSVVLCDESDLRVIAAGLAAPLADRICTPSQMSYRVSKQCEAVLQRRRDKNGDLRWVVLSGDARRLWLSVQQLALYPHLQVGSTVAPLSGQVDDWNPAGVPFGGNPDNLTVDGGDCTDSRTFTFWNVYVDVAGLLVTGLLGTALNAIPTDWGPVRFIFNSGPGDMTFGNLHAGSDVENRLVLPYAADYVLPAQCGAWVIRPFLDEGLGITVQWRLMGVSNQIFTSVTSRGPLTTEKLFFGSEDADVLAAGLTSDWDPGDKAIISVVGTAPSSIVDGLVPRGTAAQIIAGNELRIIKNVGAVPIVLVPDIHSVSAAANQFQPPGPSAIANNAPPIIIPPSGETIIQLNPGGKWRHHTTIFNTVSVDNKGESITPAAFGAVNVNDYNPTDAVSGLQGRLAGVWRVQGAVGTVLTGIEAAPANLPPFVHGDRLMLINYGSGFLLAHLSGASAVGNKIVCPPGGANNPDYTLLGTATVWLWRDGFNNTWIVEGARV